MEYVIMSMFCACYAGTPVGLGQLAKRHHDMTIIWNIGRMMGILQPYHVSKENHETCHRKRFPIDSIHLHYSWSWL